MYNQGKLRSAQLIHSTMKEPRHLAILKLFCDEVIIKSFIYPESNFGTQWGKAI